VFGVFDSRPIIYVLLHFSSQLQQLACLLEECRWWFFCDIGDLHRERNIVDDLFLDVVDIGRVGNRLFIEAIVDSLAKYYSIY
jgi:hypothetical protein